MTTHELDHPCKETCSGWKQGYEKGMLDQGEKAKGILKIVDMIINPHKHGFAFSGEVMLIVPDLAREALREYESTTPANKSAKEIADEGYGGAGW